MAISKIRIAEQLEKEFDWLDNVVDAVLTFYFKNDPDSISADAITPPELGDSAYSKYVEEFDCDRDERLILLLALAPILRPQSMDVFKIKNANLDALYSEFGGWKEGNKGAFIPTLETAIFVLAADNLSKRMELLNKFDHQHKFFKDGILQRESKTGPLLDIPLKISPEILRTILSGEQAYPEFSSRFPAQHIESRLSWDDLVVDASVRLALQEVNDWLEYRDIILEEWDFKRSLKRGYRALFYGPPGTGKTLAATLLGNSCKKPVFRVDLSMVVSKYIGETEKNLAGLFDLAEGKDWILFFDEADALFGKRTQTKGSNDRYANQEVSYLLQRIEDFQGLVILATNLKDNLDEAFSRRFQSTIQFQKPTVKEREQLWENYVFSKFILEDDVNTKEIVKKYDVTGGEILNVLRFCTIRAAKRDEKKLNQGDILAGIKREYDKTNKTF